MDILKLNAISKVANGILEGYNLTDASENPIGILVRSFKMAEYEVPASLLAVARAGAGVNNIPHDEYAKKGICVFNTPGANANAVKELVIAYMLTGARNLYEAMTWSQNLTGDDIAKQVEKGKAQFAGSEITGKTLCIMGLGAIGRKVAKAAYGLDMNVVGYDPYLSPAAKEEIPFVKVYNNKEDAYKEADFITLHMPLTPETDKMVNKESIKAMKDGVIIINAARGELVNIEDIKEALASKKVRKLVCDFPDTNTVKSEGIIVAPHIGASTEEAEDNCAEMAAKELKDYIENGNIKNSVNMPNISVEKTSAHRITIISKDNGSEEFGGKSAAKNGIRYTIIDTENSDITIYKSENIIKARLVY
ncbi:MAG: 3-phosphoglycerate dehydrogenase [Clostridia bacterium]|nr:3-phosphoglycerate dehydrogenase [Clostridia bacterium]